MDLYRKLACNMEELCSTFQSRMTSYEVGLQQLSNTGQSPHTELNNLAKDYNEFKQLMWKTINTIKAQMEILYTGQDRQEMASRRKVILLHGIEDSSDNLQNVIHNIISVRLKLPEICIDNFKCHYLGSDTSRRRPILIRFSQYAHRDLVWKAKTHLKGSGITISEFLTKARHDVFIAARKHFGVKNCWTSDGKIILLLPDKSRQKIEVMSELSLLTERFPLVASETVAAENTHDKRTDFTPVKSSKTGRSKRGNNYKGINLEQLRIDASKIDWTPILNCADVDGKVEILNKLLTELYDIHAPLKEVRVKHLPAPWLNRDIRNMMLKRDKAKRRFKNFPTDINMQTYKKLRNRCSRMCRDSKRRHIHDSLSSQSPDQMWKFLKTLGIGFGTVGKDTAGLGGSWVGIRA
ncbi:uncharacterized protein ACR2FA_005286 [Aphomia sociella]